MAKKNNNNKKNTKNSKTEKKETKKKTAEITEVLSNESDVQETVDRTEPTVKEDDVVKKKKQNKKTTGKKASKPKKKTEEPVSESNNDENNESKEEKIIEQTVETVVEEVNEPEQVSEPRLEEGSVSQEDKKKKNIIPAVAIGIILATLAFLLLLLPLIRQNDAIEKISNGKNEEAIIELDGLVPLFKINEIKEEAFDNIAYGIAEDIQNSYTKFSSDVFGIGPITDRDINLYDEFEEISFTVNYTNEECDAFVECYAEKEHDGYEWILTKCDILSTRYDVKKDCDQSVIDEVIINEYPEAVFVEKSEQQQLYQSFIYEYKDIDPENPFYYDINRLNALCVYNPSKKEWFVSEITCSVIDTEEIPLKEYTTSVFTVKLPEVWVMRIYESSWVNDYNGEHNEQYSYSYQWYAREQDAEAFNTRDGSPGVLSISVFASTYNSYSSNNNNGQTINAKYLGKGKFNENASYNGRRSYSAIFKPTIKGLVSSFTVSSEYIDPDSLIGIIDSIKLKTTTYSCEVLVNKLNIRKWASVDSERVGSTSKGQKHTATEIQDGYDGYRWYRIGENEWIADLNGEYLKVTYR